LRLGKSWIHYESDRAFTRIVYSTYGDYVAHQKSKLEHINLSDYEIKYSEVIRERLEKLNFVRHSMTVLCLAARIGTEVKSFLDIGCFAIGIDLNLGENNRNIVYGAFHDLQFSPNSIDVVFTDSVDHVFDIERLIDETKRVSKPNGLQSVEAEREAAKRHLPAFRKVFGGGKWMTLSLYLKTINLSSLRDPHLIILGMESNYVSRKKVNPQKPALRLTADKGGSLISSNYSVGEHRWVVDMFCLSLSVFSLPDWLIK